MCSESSVKVCRCDTVSLIAITTTASKGVQDIPELASKPAESMR